MLGISTLLTLLVTEAGLRVLKKNRAFQPDPRFIRSLAANNAGVTPTWETEDNLNGRSDTIPKTPGFFKTPTNNIGFRMTEDVGEKAPDEKRVLLLGDSYTEAYQVPPEERFADLTTARLRADPATRHWRVLNGGVENGCPAQYILQLRSWLTELKPDIVIVAFAPNDLMDDYTYERWYGFDFDAGGLPERVQARTELALLKWSYILRYFESATLTGAPKVHGIFFGDEQPQVPLFYWQELACEGNASSKQFFAAKTARYMRGMKEMVETAGAKFGVAMVQYPYFFEHEAYYKGTAPGLAATIEKYGCYRTKGIPYQEFVEDFFRQSGIKFRNPYWAMARAEEERPGHKLWNFYDYHYAGPGHALMADATTAVVRELIGVPTGEPAEPKPVP